MAERGDNLLLYADPRLTGEQVDIYSGEEYILTVYVGKEGQIRIRKKSGMGKKILRAVATKDLRILV